MPRVWLKKEKCVEQSVGLKQILYHLLWESDDASKYQTHSEGRTDKEKLGSVPHKSWALFAGGGSEQHPFQRPWLLTGCQQPPACAADLHQQKCFVVFFLPLLHFSLFVFVPSSFLLVCANIVTEIHEASPVALAWTLQRPGSWPSWSPLCSSAASMVRGSSSES